MSLKIVMVGENSQGQRKVTELWSESGKIDILKRRTMSIKYK